MAVTSGVRNVALRLEYDGTHLVGSQVQAAGRSVQGELEAAWQRLTGEQARWTLAGRTDAGVHALGQVANLRTTARHDLTTIQRALNALLPDDIAVRRAWEVDYDFHARFSATRRSYRYLILTERWRSPLLHQRALHIDQPLDIRSMAQAAEVLVGVQDFVAFGSAPSGTTTVRECFVAQCRTLEHGDWRLLAIDLEANAFLRHMVRTVVGTLLLIGGGKQRVEDMERILQSRDRSQAGPTAPPHGLYLMSVTYSGQE